MQLIFNSQIIDTEQDPHFFSAEAEETIKGYGWLFNNKLLFWEDVYFQLMASIRKMRYSIPLTFTPEMFEEQIFKLIRDLNISKGRYEIIIFRNSDFIIKFLPYKDFYIPTDHCIDIYKEINVLPNLLSSIYLPSPLNSIAYIYAEENDWDDLIILNNEKRIARTINGNLFIIKDNTIYTPPITEGAYISALKKNFLTFLQEKGEHQYIETKLSPFEAQSAEEIFILSDYEGCIPITKIKKKTFSTHLTQNLIKKFIGYYL